jgi:hypothetical protein
MSSVTQQSQHRTGPLMSESVKETQALAKRVVEGEIVGDIVDAQSFNAKVAHWRAQGYNVLTPSLALSSIPKDHVIAVSPVSINPDPNGGEVYQNDLFCKSGEVALSKVGLEKVAQSAGISITESRRVDSRTVEHVWSYEVRGHWLTFDGTRVDRIATKTIDFRDGSPDIKGFTPRQVEQARRHGEAICQSKATNRLYRQYGLRQKYTQRELVERPFIVMKLRWVPDESNPVIAAIVTQMRMGATALMYPQALPAHVAGFDPATAPQHMVPPELRPSTLQVIEDTADDDIPVGEPPATSTSTPRVSEQSYTLTGAYRDPNGGYYLTTKETGDERLRTDDRTLVDKARGARSLELPVRLTFDPASTPGNRRVTALNPGDHD